MLFKIVKLLCDLSNVFITFDNVFNRIVFNRAYGTATKLYNRVDCVLIRIYFYFSERTILNGKSGTKKSKNVVLCFKLR